MRKKRGIRVYCKTLNTWFRSISSAARFAGANMWTLGKKMDVSGSFIDDKGNEYIRAEPMKTKNVYEDTGKQLKRHYTKRKTKETQTVLPIEELVPLDTTGNITEPTPKVEQPVNKKVVFADYPVVVQKMIEAHAKEMLLNGAPVASIKQFLADAGCTKLTITLEA